MDVTVSWALRGLIHKQAFKKQVIGGKPEVIPSGLVVFGKTAQLCVFGA
jgi:hypothetical protein